MTEKLTTFDIAEELTSSEAIAAYMADAFESDDASYIAHATDCGTNWSFPRTALPFF